MGTVKRCIHPMAKVPYRTETTGIHLYSIEELAYYLYKNIYFIDDRALGEKLYLWIEKELKMPELAKELRNDAKENSSHEYGQVLRILKESDYYSEEELAVFAEKIKKIEGLQTQERMKYKADELLQNENYWAAVTEYEKILSIRQNIRLSVEFYGKVWNNLGTAYAGLFLFEKAASCFENAYQFQKLSEYQKKAEYARRLSNYGKSDAEQLLNYKIPKEISTEVENVLKKLEETNREETGRIILKDFLCQQEQEYHKNTLLERSEQ